MTTPVEAVTRRLAANIVEGLGDCFGWTARQLDRRPWLWGFVVPLIMLEVWLVSR